MQGDDDAPRGHPIARCRGPAVPALILTHGWPWTFWHWSKVVDPLADPGADGGDPAEAFDVLVPSFPGFGFSTPLPNHLDMNLWKVADLWHTLMTRTLGYGRYAAAGCDVGALVTGQLGHKYADALHAIHIGSGQKLTLFTATGPGTSAVAGPSRRPARGEVSGHGRRASRPGHAAGRQLGGDRRAPRPQLSRGPLPRHLCQGG